MCDSLVIKPNALNPHFPLLQELSNSIWGAATLRWPLPSTLLQCFEDTSLDLLDQFTTQNLSNTLWALAVMGHRCGPEWQFEYCKQMRGNVPHMHALQLCDVMWAMAQLRMAPPRCWSTPRSNAWQPSSTASPCGSLLSCCMPLLCCGLGRRLPG